MRAEIVEFPVDPIWKLQLESAASVASMKFLREVLEAIGIPGAGEEALAVLDEWRRLEAADPLLWYETFPTYKDVRANLMRTASNVDEETA